MLKTTSLSTALRALVLLCVAAAAGAAERPLVVVGDSLSAAYGLRAEEGWVSLLAERVESRAMPYKVVNAAISGDTTRGGKARLPALLSRHEPGVLVLELGGNDGLRGIAPNESRRNLSHMVKTALDGGWQVLLVGMRLPPNLGPAFTRAFEKMYTDIASENQVPLVPFLLEGVALDPALMQDDAIHPTAEAQPIMLDTVWPHLEPLLDE